MSAGSGTRDLNLKDGDAPFREFLLELVLVSCVPQNGPNQPGPLWESCSQEEHGPLLLVKKTAGFK